MQRHLHFSAGPEGLEIAEGSLFIPSTDPVVRRKIQDDIAEAALKLFPIFPGESAPLSLKEALIVCGGNRKSLPASVTFVPAVEAGFRFFEESTNRRMNVTRDPRTNKPIGLQTVGFIPY